MKRYMIVGIIYVVLLAIILTISWQVFPVWKTRPGGFWELFGIAAATDLVFVTGIVALWEKLKKDDSKDTSETSQPSSPPSPPVTQINQHIEKQEAENIYNAPSAQLS